jgi:hypothetical protein
MVTLIHYPLIDFSQLQGSLPRSHRLDKPVPSWVSSLSAPSSLDVTNKVPNLPHPAHRFSQPHGRINVRHDSQACSILQALVGLWPSEFYPISIGSCFQPRAPSSLSALHDFLLIPGDGPAVQPFYHYAVRLSWFQFLAIRG